MMTDSVRKTLQNLSILAELSFQHEVAQVRAHAALTDLPGEPPNISWNYVLPRLLRNATAALIDIESIIDELADGAQDLSSTARRLGQLWESVSRLSSGQSSSTAKVNAILAYELAGYQANSVCLARELTTTWEKSDTDRLMPLLGLFFRRRFFQAAKAATELLNWTPEGEVETTELLAVTAQGLVAGAILEASRYFLQGEDARLNRSLAILTVASESFAAIGAIGHYSLARLLIQTLPRMGRRSTWELLRPIHPQNSIWLRYLILLARGLGPRIDENSGIVELWPSQITAVKEGLFDHESSTMIRMPTSAGKTRIAEMAIVDHLISFPGTRCLYIAPFKALAGEIESALSGLMSDLGFRLSTTLGSFETDEAEQEILSSADVIISTPEKLDLLLRINREFFDSVGLIVTDEGQLVEDETRGPGFELLLTRIRLGWPEIKFISLSAVIPQSSLEDFAIWLGSDEAIVSQSDWRPAVQRHAMFVWRGQKGFIRFLPDHDVPGIEEFLPNITEVHEFAYVNPDTGRKNKRRFPDPLVKAQTAAELAYTLAPTGAVLVFCTTPNYAESVSDAILNRIQYTRRIGEPVLQQFAERTTRSSEICADWLGDDHPLTNKLRMGIAVHHGRVPDVVKHAIERDFRERRFQVIVATSTLAQGVNLPIKTVIVHSAYRHMENSNIPLTAREYWNIAGRAGRAGEETQGTIIHICQNQNDIRLLQSYAYRKENLEPVASALLRELMRRVDDRLSSETLHQHLDSDLLALLVEEDVSEVTDEWVEKIFASTLASAEAQRTEVFASIATQSLGNLLKSVIQRVPEKDTRITFSTTGLCIESCESMLIKIREDAADLSILLTTATLFDRRRLIEIFLDGCFVAEETRPEADPLFEVAELADAWISGEEYPSLRTRFSDPETSPQSVSAFVEDVFQYRLPWGIAAFLRLATKELHLEEAALSTLVRFFPSMFKFGVPTPFAVWGVTAGIDYRSVAIQLGQAFATSDHEQNFRSFLEWSSQWNVESLGAEFGLSGPVLEDVAFALQRVAPSPLIRQTANSDGPMFPLPAQVLITDITAVVASDSLNIGDAVQFERDYDLVFDRNAVRCYLGREPLGRLSSDIAQLLAPMMDAGSRYEGNVQSLVKEFNIRRLYVDISPLLDA